MLACDDFTNYHAESLNGRYDCVDLIVLNGFFPLVSSKVPVFVTGGVICMVPMPLWTRVIYSCIPDHAFRMAGFPEDALSLLRMMRPT